MKSQGWCQDFCCEQLKGYSCHLAKEECRRGRCGENIHCGFELSETILELVCEFIFRRDRECTREGVEEEILNRLCTGRDLMPLRSWPDLRVGRVTDWATQAPHYVNWIWSENSEITVSKQREKCKKMRSGTLLMKKSCHWHRSKTRGFCSRN